MYRFLFILFAALRAIQAECPKGCIEPTLVYEELGCTPVYEKPTDCCPVKFDCPDFRKRLDDLCIFNGERYVFGERIPENQTGNCQEGCICKTNGIKCLDIRCEHFDPNPGPGCHYTYAPDQCCPVLKICQSNRDIVCKYRNEYGNAEYNDGQRFREKYGKCEECTCQRDHSPPLNCKKRVCMSEIKHNLAIANYCAPLYHDDLCCPNKFFCPTDFYGEINEKKYLKILSGPKEMRKDGLRCRWGDEFLEVGDHMKLGKIKCQCRLPPFVTCVNN